MKLYKTYSDDDGHTYLIPKEDYKFFIKAITNLEKSIEHCFLTYKEDAMELLQEEIWDLLGKYETLEGEEHYIILESDLGEFNGK